MKINLVARRILLLRYMQLHYEIQHILQLISIRTFAMLVLDISILFPIYMNQYVVKKMMLIKDICKIQYL